MYDSMTKHNFDSISDAVDRVYNNNVYFRIYTCKLNYNKQTSVGLT